ncbi:MAG: NifU family protein [Bacteroidetes bacterium SW_10_40_5]|nr:MAG: NifU family protein [Bacteroidetes bacterium SW_10_40_5]
MTTEAQSVEVYAEATPNPEAIKFMINQTIAGSEPFDFRKVEEADKSPLAKSLFEFEFVDGVFIMNNFVSITKKPDYQWVELIPKIRNFLSEYIEAGHPIVDEELAQEAEEKKQSQSQEATSEDSEGKIKEILEQHVKPAIEMDGGAIQFKSFENGVVKLVLKGSCSGCPSSMVTLKQGIEGLLKRVVPEVESVEAEEG